MRVTTSHNAVFVDKYEVDKFERNLIEEGANLALTLCTSRKPCNLMFAYGSTVALLRSQDPVLTESYNLKEIDSGLSNDVLIARRNTAAAESCLYCLNGKPKNIIDLQNNLTAIQWAVSEMGKMNPRFIHVRSLDLLSEIPYAQQKRSKLMLLGHCWAEAKKYPESTIALMGFREEFTAMGLDSSPIDNYSELPVQNNYKKGYSEDRPFFEEFGRSMIADVIRVCLEKDKTTATHSSNECTHSSNECAHSSNECAHSSNECTHSSNECTHSSNECTHSSNECTHSSNECTHSYRRKHKDSYDYE
eukprot:GHVP01053052.1.p1 GENE.GHVP01053052.1~~GHVP01053052.1.p1  ORF type:complete len:304 (-),score=44.35 GHVP01053052.1:70-981(-)